MFLSLFVLRRNCQHQILFFLLFLLFLLCLLNLKSLFYFFCANWSFDIMQESFEEAEFSQAPLPRTSFPGSLIQSIVNQNLYIRHCDFLLWQTQQGLKMGLGLPEDFGWNIVNALNGEPNAVSFESVNYPNYYLSLATVEGNFALIIIISIINIINSIIFIFSNTR